MSRFHASAGGLALVLVAGGWAGPAQARPDWLAAALQDVPPPPRSTGADAVVLYDRVELAVDEHLRLERRERRVLRIRTAAGAGKATFGFAVEPGGTWSRARAWTVGEGRDEQSKNSDVVESTFGDQAYSDVRRVLVRAPRPRPGDLVAVEFVASERLPFASYAWTPQFHDLPVARATMALELPAGWSVSARASGFVPRESVPDARHHTWEAGPFDGASGEDHAPPHRSHQPRVLLRFTGAAGAHDFADWRKVAAWYHGLASPHFAAAAVPAELMARGTGQPLVLVREVQHGIGYAAVELGGQRWEPDAARATWSRRYGDCKDKAVLLVAALRAVGIEAQPALACTREAGAVDAGWPDPRQFNHCIVAIAEPNPLTGLATAGTRVKGPSGRAWTLFDPTDPGTAFGLLPWSLGGTNALIADPAEGLVQIPPADPGRLRFALGGALDGAGAMDGHLRIEAERGAAGWLAGQFGGTGEETRRERLAQLLNTTGARAEVTAVRWLAADSSRHAVALEAEVRLAGAARRAGRSWLVTPPFPLQQRDPPRGDSARVAPYWLGWSPAIEGRLELELPPGLMMAPQAATTWSGATGSYRLGWQQTGRRLLLERRADVRLDEVPAAQWSDARALLQAMYTGDNAPVILKGP